MEKTIVIYGSHYGTTKAYAERIAEALACHAVSVKQLKGNTLAGCDTVIFGGGVYAGSIAGWRRAARRIVKARPRRVLLFACGLADPAKEKTQKEARMLFEKRLPDAMRALPVFCLRGGIDYAKLKCVHRAMMAMLMKLLKNKKDPSEEDRQLMQTYGKKADFFAPSAAQPVIDAAKE